MAFFDDFANALKDYPVLNTKLSFVDVLGPGPDVNTNELWSFQVRVTNDGHLNMTDVFLEIDCFNGTQVGLNVGSLGNFIIYGSLTVNGGGSSTDTPTLLFKAPPLPQPPFTTLMNVKISSWNADLSRLLITETTFVPAHFGHLIREVK